MGPPSYMQSVVDRNVVIRRMTVHMHANKNREFWLENYALNAPIVRSTPQTTKSTAKKFWENRMHNAVNLNVMEL